MKTLLTIITGVLLISGCATKQYPQASSLTHQEASTLDCKTVALEIAKGESIRQEIERTGQFDTRTVLGFLGDFGIGNGLAKSDARKKIQLRLEQLQAQQTAICRANKQ